MGKTVFGFKFSKSISFFLSLIASLVSIGLVGQIGPPEGLTRIFATSFSDTELSIYDDGNDWNYRVRDDQGAECNIWEENSNFPGPPKIQTEVENDNSPLQDYAIASIVDIGGNHGKVIQFVNYKLDGISSGTRLQLQGSLSRSDINRVYISFDMYVSSDIKKAFDIYGNNASFVFSEFHGNGSDPHYGIRARVTYIDNKVVYHANCKISGSTIWAAGDPPGGRVEMQFDEWIHIEILCEANEDGRGDYRIWATQDNTTKLVVNVEDEMVGYPIKSNIHWIKNYPDGDIMGVADAGVLVRYDNLQAYASAGSHWPSCDPIDNSDSEPPVIEDQAFSVDYDSISEGSYYIGKVEAYDSDEEETLTYSITKGNDLTYYSIDSQSADLWANDENYFNSAPRIDSLTIKVTDDGPGNLSSEAIVEVHLNKLPELVNNNPPEMEDQQFTINETDFIDNFVGTILAEDDPGQTLTYSIVSGNEADRFELNSQTGQLWVAVDNIFELEKQEYQLLVMVEDDGEESASDQATITVSMEKGIAIVYINPENVNDDLEDGSIEHPYNSWNDVGWIEGYSYLQKRGTVATENKVKILANDITLGAYGEGEKPVILSMADDYAIRVFEKSNIRIQNIHIIAESAISSIYFLGDNCDNITIENSKFESSNNGVRIVGGLKFTIRYNTFKGNWEAVHSYSRQTNVYYNIFENNQYAININGENSASEIYNNVFYDNNAGISTDYGELTLHNNIFYLAKTGDKAINHSGKQLVSDYNIFFPDQEGLIIYNGKEYLDLTEFQQIEGIDKQSFASNPLFKDIYNHNFSLEPESPAIDAGIDVGITEDLIGEVVPYGDSPDIGALEITEPANPTLSPTNNENSLIYIFPNPTTGILNVATEIARQKEVILQIQDINGQTVLAKKYANPDSRFDQTIDITSLPMGIYILTLKFANSIHFHKIIKSF